MALPYRIMGEQVHLYTWDTKSKIVLVDTLRLDASHPNRVQISLIQTNDSDWMEWTLKPFYADLLERRFFLLLLFLWCEVGISLWGFKLKNETKTWNKTCRFLHVTFTLRVLHFRRLPYFHSVLIITSSYTRVFIDISVILSAADRKLEVRACAYRVPWFSSKCCYSLSSIKIRSLSGFKLDSCHCSS